MGDRATLAKARQELEELYLGVPDDSVDLTLKDLPSFQQNEVAERKTADIINLTPIHEEYTTKDLKTSTSSFGKSPSLDFVKGLQGVRQQNTEAQQELHREREARNSFKRSNIGARNMVHENSQVYNDFSALSMVGPLEERGGRRRQGIPHSNICTLCSVYIYFFRQRCLVCGRVYCRQCVRIGMGEMAEGRKCVECLGRRFSQRYIDRAGNMGCCWRYPTAVKLQEQIWAEKGPRQSGERRCRVGMASRSMPGTPTRSRPSAVLRSPVMMPGTPRSFVSTTSPSSYAKSSTFSPSPHAFPL